MQGYLREVSDAELMVRPPVLGDWTAEFGYRAGRELLNRADFTAVFCSNDLTALGLLHAFRESGIRVPADVSVVGFDDVPEAAHYWPPLTTIRQDFDEVGRRALALLLAELGSGDDRGHGTDQAPVGAAIIDRSARFGRLTRNTGRVSFVRSV